MKKILIIYWIIIAAWIYLAFTAIAANAKKPSFFVPEGTFNTSADKTRIIPKTNRNGGIAATHNDNSLHFTAHNKLNVRKMNVIPAPVDEIAKINHLPKSYTQSIVKSFTLSKTQLNRLLQDEFNRINQNTGQLRQILSQWPTQSKAYKLANYLIQDQSSQEITKSRRQMKDIKEKYQQFLTSSGSDGKFYIIEAKDPSLYLLTDHSLIKGHLDKITYISVFDNSKKHVFSYNRLHQDMLEDKQIPKINQPEYATYYQSFDDYLSDLRRIGQGLDVKNPTLLRQIGEMEDVVILAP